MFHILHWFNLEQGVSEQNLRNAVERFTTQLQEISLVVSAGSLGRRCSDAVTDTDTERDQKYFYIMSFRDREQSERAYAYIEDPADPEIGNSHDAIVNNVKDAIFICWEDI